MSRLSRRHAAVDADAPALADAQLWERVRSLPRAQREAVVLRYVDDLPLADIALVIGCREGTVKTHLQRARAVLAAQLDTGDRSPPTEADPR